MRRFRTVFTWLPIYYYIDFPKWKYSNANEIFKKRGLTQVLRYQRSSNRLIDLSTSKGLSSYSLLQSLLLRYDPFTRLARIFEVALHSCPEEDCPRIFLEALNLSLHTKHGSQGLPIKYRNFLLSLSVPISVGHMHDALSCIIIGCTHLSDSRR